MLSPCFSFFLFFFFFFFVFFLFLFLFLFFWFPQTRSWNSVWLVSSPGGHCSKIYRTKEKKKRRRKRKRRKSRKKNNGQASKDNMTRIVASMVFCQSLGLDLFFLSLSLSPSLFQCFLLSASSFFLSFSLLLLFLLLLLLLLFFFISLVFFVFCPDGMPTCSRSSWGVAGPAPGTLMPRRRHSARSKSSARAHSPIRMNVLGYTRKNKRVLKILWFQTIHVYTHQCALHGPLSQHCRRKALLARMGAVADWQHQW